MTQWVKKDICHQAQQPEFDLWDTEGTGKNRLLQAVLYMHTVTHVYPYTHHIHPTQTIIKCNKYNALNYNENLQKYWK